MATKPQWGFDYEAVSKYYYTNLSIIRVCTQNVECYCETDKAASKMCLTGFIPFTLVIKYS